MRFADIVLPLAIPNVYTYAVPVEIQKDLAFGQRVEVPVRNKLYSGVVVDIHDRKPVVKTRNIVSIIDSTPSITPTQYAFWKWISEYYCAYIGEVMNIALPTALKLASETKIVFIPSEGWEELELTDDQYLVCEALSIQQELTIGVIQEIVGKKTVYPLIKSLMQLGLAGIREDIQEKYFSRKEDYVELLEPFDQDIQETINKLSRSELQQRAVLGIYSLRKREKSVSVAQLKELASIDRSVINSLVKKGIIKIFSKNISRLEQDRDSEKSEKEIELSPSQVASLASIKSGFLDKRPVLLHGITGSGKTQIYVKLIQEYLSQGGQVLYLLPEIALTSQIVKRLQAVLEDSVFIYHSKVHDQKRVEIYQAAMHANKLFIGARSAVFLPFTNLKLIVIDEEHDPSYKQQQPSPKYNARDAGIMLAHMTGANIVLGSATPSLESMLNASKQKHHYVQLNERYGAAQLPEIELVNMRKAYEEGLVTESISHRLLDLLKETLGRRDQSIIFQNRRGYAPILKCVMCGWTVECPNCDVSLTYHQYYQEMKCHCCGYRTKRPTGCLACGHHELKLIGIGTEKIEETLQRLLPEARIARFDHDSTRSKKNQDKILCDFESGLIDILVGTQMITKGFDFDRISLVGVISSDGLLNYPDYRASERGFQLLMQVSGRAGRREKVGQVIIQGYNISHPVLRDILSADYESFATRELKERETFKYPPYYFMVLILLTHKQLENVKEAASSLVQKLRLTWGNRVTGPVDPTILRVRGQYQQQIMIKYERRQDVATTMKRSIGEAIEKLKQESVFKNVVISIDIDPY